MLFIVFQLILLFLFVFLLGSLLTNNKVLRQILFIVGGLFVTLQISSVILGNALIDYKYYTHWNFGVVKNTAGFFAKEGVKLTFAFIGIMILINLLARRFSTKVGNYKMISVLVLLICGGLMFLKNGVISNISEISQLHFAKNKKFSEALTQLKLNEYVRKEDVKAKAGKNIVVLILESLEASFLKDNLAHLSPNLRRLSQEMTYYNMKEAEGSDYTIGAIYTYLTGFPHFFKNHGNDIFAKSADIKITSISNALSAAGYNQLYLLGNPDFAGTRKMLNLMDIETKSEEDYDPKYKLDYWGMHDKDLFDLAQEEIKALKEKDKPFAFYLSTISTHHPDGVFDERMVDQFPTQKSKLELMALSLDKHINDLVEFLKKEELIDNTAIYILPDHLLMGQASRVLNDFIEARELFLITNTESKTYSKDENILQIDIPRIILEGAEVETNMSFLADIIKGDKYSYIKSNKHRITQLNESALTVLNESERQEKNKPKATGFEKNENVVYVKSKSWLKDKVSAKSDIFIGMEERVAQRGVNVLVYDNGEYLHEVFETYENANEIDRLLKRLTELVEQKAYFITLVHDSAGDKFPSRKEAFEAIGFKRLGRIPDGKAYVAVSNEGFTSERIKRQAVHAQIPFKPRKPFRSKTEIAQQANDPNRMIAHAGGIYKGKTYTNCLEAMNLSYEKGFKLFELDIIKTIDGHYVAYHDWEQWRKKTGYAGKIPVDRKTFLTHRKEGKGTSMDMAMINEWFTQHPDAILVTDKVNDPEAFVPQFVDRKRLMMELFSFDAVEKAQELGIRDVILSQNMWDYLGENKVEDLRNRKINYVAISRRTLDRHRHIYKDVNESGIKIFAFHVNHDDHRDEAYMFREGMDFCYGFYADDWERR